MDENETATDGDGDGNELTEDLDILEDEDDFTPEGNGQMDLEGKRVEHPIKHKTKTSVTHTYKNQLAKVSFTEDTIKSQCLDPPEGKDAISIRQFVQDRIGWVAKSPLTGDEMQSLVEQFEKAIRKDWA